MSRGFAKSVWDEHVAKRYKEIALRYLNWHKIRKEIYEEYEKTHPEFVKVWRSSRLK